MATPFETEKTFANMHLPEDMVQGLIQLGYNAPSSAQEILLPALLASSAKNMLGNKKE